MNLIPSPRPAETHAGASRGAPRLALVLGSGGVRSVAAIGMAAALAAEGISPDLVVGCSSGALFGATIASGMSAAEAFNKASALWSADLTQKRRWRSYLQLVAPRLAGFDAGFSLRDGRLIGQRITRAFGSWRIEHLPTELRVVATDAASGRSVVLRRGPLAEALRASLAVPFIFPSVEVEGRRLVDGVISDPLPLRVASDAAVIIALGFDGAMPRRVDRASRLVAQTSTALINNLMQARMDAAEARGQRVIHLDLALDRRIGLWDTRAMPALFDAGLRATQKRMTEIAAALAMAPHRSAA